MSKVSPRFSVLIPVYNVEKYLSSCIDSVLNQSFKDYEILLADDGSKDSSFEICQKYAQKFENIRAFSKANEGPFKTRLFLLSKAKGEFVVFLDSDDWLDESTLSCLDEIIKEEKPDCVVYNILEHQGGREILWTSPADVDVKTVIEDKAEIARIILFNESYNSMCRKAVRREIIGEENFTEYLYIKHGEDLIQSLEVLKSCNKFVFIPDAFYHYRRNPASLTSSIDRTNFKIDFNVEKAVMDFAIREKIFGENQIRDLDALRIMDIRIASYSTIFQIAKLNTSSVERIKLFEELAENDFFKNYLNNGKPVDYSGFEKEKALYYKLFVQKRYKTLILLGNIARLKHLIKH
ncbi:MAG: glycosyltransferase [Sphaerochaetaceae bacterium]|nr:glycosyltransferase [Sphaerochaetaceae bacterium]